MAPNGTSSGDGSPDHPSATLVRARDHIRKIISLKGVPIGGIEVIVRSGNYTLNETLNLDNLDSGTEGSPIVYRSEKGQVAGCLESCAGKICRLG